MFIPIDVRSLITNKEQIPVNEWSERVQKLIEHFLIFLVASSSDAAPEPDMTSDRPSDFRILLDAQSRYGNIWGAGFGEATSKDNIEEACTEALNMAKGQHVPIELSQRIFMGFAGALTVGEAETATEIFQDELYKDANAIFSFGGSQTKDSVAGPFQAYLLADRPKHTER